MLGNSFMPFQVRLFLFFLVIISSGANLQAQLPFYTDDTEVTAKKKVHMEFFNEIDALESAQFPSHKCRVNS